MTRMSEGKDYSLPSFCLGSTHNTDIRDVTYDATKNKHTLVACSELVICVSCFYGFDKCLCV